MNSRKFKAFDGGLVSRSELSIAQGALTNSKRFSCFVKGVYPTHLRDQRGCYSVDTQGNTYIDFISGLGSNILGFNHEEVNRAIRNQLDRGITFSMATELEIQCAEKVKECFPWVDKVRFLKTGSEACSAALRIARAYSKHDTVFSSGYHGWSDSFTALTPPHLGVPSAQYTIQGEDPLPGSGGLIIEPVLTDAGPGRIQRLREIREGCSSQQIPLIFDEIITGFRTPRFGMCNFAGVEPDLLCLGKAIGNGMPLSVVAGKNKFMECGDYFVSSTFAGETLSLAAALKTMSLLQTKYHLNYLWAKGEIFLREFNALSPDFVRIEGYPTRGVFKGDPQSLWLFWQEACKAGLLFGPSFFFNFSHIDVMDQVLSLSKQVLQRVRSGSVKLEGEPPVTPYAMKVRQQ